MGRAQQQASSGPLASRCRINNRGSPARGWNGLVRTSVFRRSVENQLVINLIDECGNQISAIQGGRMNITSHESILAAVKNRASRYSNRGFTHRADNNLVSWALDERGTVDASFLCNNNENNEQIVLVEQQERNRVAELGVPEEVL